MYPIQHYVIKFVSDFRQVVVFSNNKAYRHYITEILLKVALNTNQTLKFLQCYLVFLLPKIVQFSNHFPISAPDGGYSRKALILIIHLKGMTGMVLPFYRDNPYLIYAQFCIRFFFKFVRPHIS